MADRQSSLRSRSASLPVRAITMADHFDQIIRFEMYLFLLQLSFAGGSRRLAPIRDRLCAEQAKTRKGFLTVIAAESS